MSLGYRDCFYTALFILQTAAAAGNGGGAMFAACCCWWCIPCHSGTVTAFTETSEFVRSIQVEQPKAAEDGSSYMDVDEQPAAAAAAAAMPLPPPPEAPAAVKAPRQRNLRKGGWTTVEGEDDQPDQEVRFLI